MSVRISSLISTRDVSINFGWYDEGSTGNMASVRQSANATVHLCALTLSSYKRYLESSVLDLLWHVAIIEPFRVEMGLYDHSTAVS
jgi:hypothetical protein